MIIMYSTMLTIEMTMPATASPFPEPHSDTFLSPTMLNISLWFGALFCIVPIIALALSASGLKASKKKNYGDGDARDTLSTTYKGSSGKTLQETLIEETKAVDWNSVKAAIENDIDDYYSKQGLNRKEIMQKAANAVQTAQNIFDSTFKQTNSYFTANNARSDYLHSQEYVDIMADYQKIRKMPNEIKRKWGDLSDVYSGVTKDRERLASLGHPRKYWTSDVRNRGMEAFAEIASAKATSQESYNVFKKYLPDVTNLFEEIYTKLKNGEIKQKGRTKYAP